MERAHEEATSSSRCRLNFGPNKHAIKEVIDKIEHYRKGRDVYVVGVTNVGKSTLINAIIQEITGDQNVITTSRFPGTTFGQNRDSAWWFVGIHDTRDYPSSPDGSLLDGQNPQVSVPKGNQT